MRKSTMTAFAALTMPLLASGMLLLAPSTADACCVTATPPVIDSVTVDTGFLDPAMCWPPNHKMVEAALTVQGTDFLPEDWYVSGVTVGNNGPGEGDPKNDPDYYYDGMDMLTQENGGQIVELRCERSGKAGARVYTVYVTAWNNTDTDTSWVQVTVPHSNPFPD